MLTRMQSMYDYTGYIKCGEILRPPCESSTRPYALKCFYCKEIYLLFEAFIFHIEDHCRKAIAKVEYDSTNADSLSFDQDNTKQKQKTAAYHNEEEQNKSLLLAKKPAFVNKSNYIAEDSKDILDNAELSPPVDIKTNRSSPLRFQPHLNKNYLLSDSSNIKKATRQRRAPEKFKNNAVKTTSITKDKFKKNITRSSSGRIVRIDKIHELELKGCEKKVKQQSNANQNHKTIDIREGYTKFIESGEEYNTDEELLSSDDDSNEICIETFQSAFVQQINK